MGTKERASYLARQCHGREEAVKEVVMEQEKEEKNPVLFLMKAGTGSKGISAKGSNYKLELQRIGRVSSSFIISKFALYYF